MRLLIAIIPAMIIAWVIADSRGSGDVEGDSEDLLAATPAWPLLLLLLLPAMSLAKKGSVV